MVHLSLQNMCHEVFVLDEKEFRILKYLALHGPMNLNQLSKYTKKYADSMDRWGVKKRLDGTPKFLGLIPNEYVLEENVNKKRYKKQEKRYWLSVKGIIASTAVVPLQKNGYFKHYSWFLSKFLEEENIRPFIERHIEENMKLLVAWHYLNGIQLTKQRSSPFYYLEFFEHLRNVGIMDITISDKIIDDEFITIVKNCMASFAVIDLLTDHEMYMFQSLLSIVDWEKTKVTSDQRKHHWYAKIWEWPLYLGNVIFQQPGFSINLVKSPKIRDEVYLESIYSKDLNQKVDNILNEIRHKIDWESRIS